MSLAGYIELARKEACSWKPSPRPARTIVPVPALRYAYLVEMDAIAALRRS